MIEAKHKQIWELFFVLYSRIMLRKIFHDVRVHFSNSSYENKSTISAGEEPSQNNISTDNSSQNNTATGNSFTENISDHKRSVLMISNHIFFWDGFVQMLLARKFFNKKIFIMMLEEQLSKRMFLTHGGCFSVKKSSRDLINSLNYACSKLGNSSNMVLIFPQGEIQSLYTPRIKFEKGIEYILKKKPDCDIWFNVNLINFYSRKKPTLNIYLKQFNTTKLFESNISCIENAFNIFATQCQSQESDKIKGEPLL